MCNQTVCSIKEEWKNYYNLLEAVRRTGVCNMLKAHIYLTECFKELSEEEAKSILKNWMDNYEELDKKYDWRNTTISWRE